MREQTALVTGASAGIGRAIAARLADEGFRVVNIDRSPPPLLLSGEVFVQGDLADARATTGLLGRLNREFHFAALVNNVGTVRPAPLEQATIEDLQAVVALNLGASLLCTQSMIAGMKERRFGRIVNISSRAPWARSGAACTPRPRPACTA